MTLSDQIRLSTGEMPPGNEHARRTPPTKQVRQSSIENRKSVAGLTPCSSLLAALPLGQASRIERSMRRALFLVKQAASISQLDGQARVVIEGVTPEIDRGRFPIKRVPGEDVAVEADI